MQTRTSRTLSYAQVIGRLAERGIVVNKGDLKRAMWAEQIPWGKAAAKASFRRGISPAHVAGRSTSGRESQKVRAELVTVVHRLRMARPSLTVSEVSRGLPAKDLRVSDAEVESAFRTDQRGGRAGGRPTAVQRELARQASLINGRAARELSFTELVSRLGEAGWVTHIADLEYALFVTRTKLGDNRPATQRGAQTATSAKSSPDGSTDDEGNDASFCRACGMHVSVDGYCRCS